ncbi:P-II family nitrogen regulator [Enterococcus timonensis]|uniref:P-II family nitrogen regulator n=1 Tax=Enterococcus timonensis TaxID=1852364 RepID=UPI0008DA8186|nr:P-II family nitrogen regulator [Enterococcus timonensis]
MKKLVGLDYEMIITIVDSGNGSDVVDFAKKAGAKGSTILHGRGSGVHDTGKFFGIEIEPEKEIVITLVPHALTNHILKAVGEGIAIDKPGHGICFVVDISKIIGITQMSQDSKVVEIDDLLELED